MPAEVLSRCISAKPARALVRSEAERRRVAGALCGKIDRPRIAPAAAVEAALKLPVERDHVDVEDAARPVERVVDVRRDLVHESEHATAGREREPQIAAIDQMNAWRGFNPEI